MRRLIVACLLLLTAALLVALLQVGLTAHPAKHPSHCPHTFSSTCLHQGRGPRGAMTVPGKTP